MGSAAQLAFISVLSVVIWSAAARSGRIVEIQEQFDGGSPVLFTLQAGLNGSESALSDFWEVADSYIFVRRGGLANTDDINADSSYSTIGYSSFMRNDTFNTFFMNDGLGNEGYSGVIYNKSAWDGNPAYPLQPMVLMQGWMIDSWPDYRFIGNDSLSPNEQRYFGLQSPSGYRTTVNFQYFGDSGYLTEEQAREGSTIPAPPYVVGNNSDLGYFSYKINESELNEEAFIEYYRDTLNSSAGDFNVGEYVDGMKQYDDTGSTQLVNVNFFQGLIDFEDRDGSIDEAFDKVIQMRNWYFKNRLWGSSQPPSGTDSEIDIAAYSIKYADNQTFVANIVPYSAVAAVGLFHSGPKWTLPTRPQPPHLSARESWSVSPEYYSIYVPATYLQSNISSKLNGSQVDMVEVHNLIGTNLALEELEDAISSWSDSPGSKSKELITPWTNLYPETSEDGFEVVSLAEFLSSPENTPSRAGYLKVILPADSSDPVDLGSISGESISQYGVWLAPEYVSMNASSNDRGYNMSGSLGSDDMYGGYGDDVLVAFSGTDRLTGGPGADEFFIQNCAEECLQNSGSMTMAIITDLEEGENISLVGVAPSADVRFRAVKWPGQLIEETNPSFAYRGDAYTEILVDSKVVAQVWRTSPSDLQILDKSVIKKTAGLEPALISACDMKLLGPVVFAFLSMMMLLDLF